MGRGIYERGMPRKRRVEYAGAMYHVMSRGDRSEDIFLDDVESTIGKAASTIGSVSGAKKSRASVGCRYVRSVM